MKKAKQVELAGFYFKSDDAFSFIKEVEAIGNTFANVETIKLAPGVVRIAVGVIFSPTRDAATLSPFLKGIEAAIALRGLLGDLNLIKRPENKEASDDAKDLYFKVFEFGMAHYPEEMALLSLLV